MKNIDRFLSKSVEKGKLEAAQKDAIWEESRAPQKWPN
jgi:hypothetical protein